MPGVLFNFAVMPSERLFILPAWPFIQDKSIGRLLHMLALLDKKATTVYIQVRATDVLIFANGAPTPEDLWTFWLKTPAEWALAADLQARVLRVTQSIYEQMNQQMATAANYDGARYQLRRVIARVLTPREEAEKPWLTRSKALYLLQADESVAAV